MPNYDGSPQAKNHKCVACGRAMVYADSLVRHRAVCSVRLRAILLRVLAAADAADPPFDPDVMVDIREVLREDGQGR